MSTLLITGAAGFVGSHVAREAARQGLAVRLMTHRRTAPAGSAGASVRGDLTDPGSLRGSCDGVDVVVHCAAQIGGTAEANEAVNVRGTAALLEEAARAGVSRVVHLSTASVYGRGTYVNSRPEDLVRNPGSPTSHTRALAEDAVLAAGGTVLRPHLVLGEGDTWVVPGLARVLHALPGSVAGWPARLSLIGAPALARLLLGVALAPAGRLRASVYHAVHPEPVTVATLLGLVAECAGLPLPAGRITEEDARELLTRAGLPPRSLDMFTTDHWFDGAPLWADLGADPGPGPAAEGFAGAAPWYARIVREAVGQAVP
ncbi:NAD-dependent epimerase/dehydratase family protein [Streptomyces sp. NPDC090022]|uniref:NAD-dependent epimerase/dehydratase family protein n=1 Tax=Streptomyces sp. NPDC090022 TaxID=3365920 RepID=UPI0038261A2B